MQILLDNSETGKISFVYTLDTKIIHCQEYAVSIAVSPLIYLERLLKKVKKQLADVTGLAVIIGKGSFTSTRVAVTLANTLALALQIPVAAVEGGKKERWLEILSLRKKGEYILAQYSGPANIGKKHS